MNNTLGKYIIVAGCIIIIAGVIVYFFHDKLNWIGKLPGDIRIEKKILNFISQYNYAVIKPGCNSFCKCNQEIAVKIMWIINNLQ